MLLVDIHLMNMGIYIGNLKKDLKVQRAKAKRKKTLNNKATSLWNQLITSITYYFNKLIGLHTFMDVLPSFPLIVTTSNIASRGKKQHVSSPTHIHAMSIP